MAQKMTTAKLRVATMVRLRELIKLRDRNESIDQIVIELLSTYKGK
jgi:hypothetical protein